MQIEIGNNDINPWLPGNGSFGLYNWRQNPVQGNPLPWTAPFTNGAKFGHCIELEQGSATVNGTLRSGSDLRLDNATNTISQGDTDPRVAQIQWLLQSSYRAAAVGGPNFTNGVEPGAHQSAIWKITNPTDPANDIGASGSAARIAADALADQLLAAAQANSGAVNPATWSLTIQGGNDPTCAGTTRTVLVKGSPNTVAKLTITAGRAHFPNGTQTTDVVLGADGTGSVDLIDDGTTADTVSISASLPSWILAQADNGNNQDFAYLEKGGDVVKEVSISFKPCNQLQPLSISKTADPLFTRTYRGRSRRTSTARRSPRTTARRRSRTRWSPRATTALTPTTGSAARSRSRIRTRPRSRRRSRTASRRATSTRRRGASRTPSR